MVPDLDPDKPDPDPVWLDLDPAISGSGSSLPGSRYGNIRIWIRLLPDLDPVAAGSKVPHELSGPVQALGWSPPPEGSGHTAVHVHSLTKDWPGNRPPGLEDSSCTSSLSKSELFSNVFYFVWKIFFSSVVIFYKEVLLQTLDNREHKHGLVQFDRNL